MWAATACPTDRRLVDSLHYLPYFWLTTRETTAMDWHLLSAALTTTMVWTCQPLPPTLPITDSQMALTDYDG